MLDKPPRYRSYVLTVWEERSHDPRARAVWLSQLDPGTLTALIDKSAYEGFEAETTLKRISCPVLLIHGDPAKGSVLTREHVEAIQSAIPDCVADLLEAGSEPRSEHPVRTLQILLYFLESL